MIDIGYLKYVVEFLKFIVVLVWEYLKELYYVFNCLDIIIIKIK